LTAGSPASGAVILLPMQIDPMVEWQRITNVYREMYDDELVNLVADEKDLTEIARQVLDLELKRRGLGTLSNPSAAQNAPEPMLERRAPLLGNQGGAPQIILDHRGTQDREAPLEYSWKTLLCECDSTEQAELLCETLRRAGIDNWIDGPGTGFRYKGFEIPNPRVLVAADQLDQARSIMANPIPQEVIDESKETVPVFEMPRCPHCGAKDPALEGVEPFNSWRCEGCGCQWTESEAVQPAQDATEGEKAS
jgi:hypothetical protein